MGQNLSCVEDGSCESPGSVVLPQEPISVSDYTMQELIECINNYILDEHCSLSTIRELIRETKRNPADIIRHLEDSRAYPDPNRNAYSIVARYTNLIDAFRDIQEKYHQERTRAVLSIPDVQRDIPPIHQAIKRALREEVKEDQKTIDGLYRTHFEIGKQRFATHGNYAWLHNERPEYRRESVNDLSTWKIGYGNTGGGSTPKKPRRKKKRTRRKKRTQRKKTTQRKKRTKSV